MSEEILKALMQLFAIIAKQDDGISENEKEYVHSFLREQLNETAVIEYQNLFDKHLSKGKKKKSKLGLSRDKDQEPTQKEKDSKLTAVGDSVRTLGIAKKINRTLAQKQKVIVLVRLFELVNTDRKFTDQRMSIINTIAEVFNIKKEEYQAIESFVIANSISELNNKTIMVINDGKSEPGENCKTIQSDNLDGEIIILKINSADLYFLRYTGSDEIQLNGLLIHNKRISLFANGSIIKLPKSKPIFYSDVVAKFLADASFVNLTFEVKNLEFQFPNGNIGLRNIDFTEGSGRLIGIMGASGAGKTTMLNVLSGNETPSKGDVLINGINLHKEKEKIKGIIGYIPQDDLLIEELTVYQNLFYNAKLCFKDKTDNEIDELVIKTLKDLGLYEARSLKVGNPLKKTISGGQRKRLNIALELIREPAVLFVDEPTSGLSSRDSDNVMGLLRELTLKGKLIFVVIHQPSSDIYKLFDSIMFLDTGGYLAYYGNPVEAIMYFKRIDNQVNSDVGECPTCGNANPEIIFNIMEARIVDEYGQTSDNRKIEPTKWAEIFKKERIEEKHEVHTEKPPNMLKIPKWIKQLRIFFMRDLLAKLSNSQYMSISLLEAPLLGFLLAFIIRYISDTDDHYVFRNNENIYPYVFMSIIVLLFIGLTVSAEEIFKDRKILKREKFLNLSKSSYLISKISILFMLSAVQAFLYVIVGNTILEIKGMTFEYWLVLFSIACSANVMGLNISATFNSAVTIYILIPLLIIPQMMLSGAMFSFDKLNKFIGGGSNTPPFIAEIMPSRWGFEALVVKQSRDNKYQKYFKNYDKLLSVCDYKIAYYIPEMMKYIDDYDANYYEAIAKDSTYTIPEDDIKLLKNELAFESKYGWSGTKGIKFSMPDSLTQEHFSIGVSEEIRNYLQKINDFYNTGFIAAENGKDQKISAMQSTPKLKKAYDKLYDTYFNQNLHDVVLNKLARNKIIVQDHRLIQKIDPLYLDPTTENLINFRTHFYAPKKQFLGIKYDSFYFNVFIIWVFSILLYITLYYDGLIKLLASISKLGELVSPFIQKSIGATKKLVTKIPIKKKADKNKATKPKVKRPLRRERNTEN